MSYVALPSVKSIYFRDSNYIYGPSIPRTFFLGIKFGSFK